MKRQILLLLRINIVILSTGEWYVRYNMRDIDRIPVGEIPDRLHINKMLQYSRIVHIEMLLRVY